MCSNPIIEELTLSLPNISTDLYKLISKIRPDWNASNTRLITFTEGITNAILGLFDNRTGDDRSKGLVIKLFGSQTELFIDRQSEIDSMVKLYDYGALSQRILIKFNNGIIYEFAEGTTCSRDDVRKENISKLIAKKLAQLHSVPVEKYEKPYLILLLRKFIQLLNEKKQINEGFYILFIFSLKTRS